MESTTPVMCTPARRKMSGPTGSSGGTSTCSKVTPNIYTPATRPVSLKKTPTSRFTGTDSFGRRSPLSPLHNLMDQMRSKVDRKLEDSRSGALSPNGTSSNVTSSNGLTQPDATSVGDDNISPGLARLRNTPVGVFKARQELLVRKHADARARADSLSGVGGGVSLWPCMARMRLTREEGAALVVVSVALVLLSVAAFRFLHGNLQWNMLQFYDRVSQFNAGHPVEIHSGGEAFNSSLLRWHTAYLALVDEVHATFDVTLDNTTLAYKTLVALYVCGLGVLIYYLVDNIWAKSKLTPKRIKVWVCILAVIGTWTLLGLQLLVIAQTLETTLEINVHWLNAKLAELVYTDLDLRAYDHVLLYWRTRMLPPTTRGTLSIMGVVAVRDVTYYLQYYSLPVLTALLTPVVQLVLALKDVYWIKTHRTKVDTKSD